MKLEFVVYFKCDSVGKKICTQNFERKNGNEKNAVVHYLHC